MLKKNYHAIPVLFTLITSLVLGGCDSQSQDAEAKSNVAQVSQQTETAPKASAISDTAEDVQKTADTVKEQVTDAATQVKEKVEEVKPQGLAEATKSAVTTTASNLKPEKPDHPEQLAPRKTDVNKRSLTANPDIGNTSKRFDKGEDEPQATPSGDSSPEEKPKPVEAFVTLSPTQLDVGEIATGDTGVGTVTLTNGGDQPVTLNKPRVSCGCTSTGVKKGSVLDPGESLDVEIRLRAGNTSTKLTKTVTFLFLEDSHPPIRMPLLGKAVSYVAISPRVVHSDREPQAKFTLKSTDGEPFRITSMTPGIIEEFPDESKLEHEVVFDWETWQTLGKARKVQFFTDHPRCARVFGSITYPREPRRPKDSDEKPTGEVASNLRIPETKPKSTKPAPPPANQWEQLIENGQGAKVLEKVQGGLNVDTRERTGATLLGLAAKHGDIELMRSLIELGADIEAPDRAGLTPLMAAAQCKNIDAVRLLLETGASLEAKDAIGGTALTWAATRGNAETVSELIDNGAQVNVVGGLTGLTPLIWAAGFGEDPKAIGILIEAGADISAADLYQGATVLHHASRTGSEAALRELLKYNPDLEARDRNGQTALLSAIEFRKGTLAKIKMLVEAGADIHAKDNRDLGILDFARRRTAADAPEIIDYLNELLGAVEDEVAEE